MTATATATNQKATRPARRVYEFEINSIDPRVNYTGRPCKVSYVMGERIKTGDKVFTFINSEGAGLKIFRGRETEAEEIIFAVPYRDTIYSQPLRVPQSAFHSYGSKGRITMHKVVKVEFTD